MPGWWIAYADSYGNRNRNSYGYGNNDTHAAANAHAQITAYTEASSNTCPTPVAPLAPYDGMICRYGMVNRLRWIEVVNRADSEMRPNGMPEGRVATAPSQIDVPLFRSLAANRVRRPQLLFLMLLAALAAASVQAYVESSR